MTEKINIDTILEWFKEQIENKQPVGAGNFLDGAFKLNILLEDLDNEIVGHETALSYIRADYIKDGKSVAQAQRLAEATEDFTKLRYLKAKKDRVVEFIKLSKKRVENQYHDY